MNRVNGLLLLALIVSSIYLVRVSYDTRRLFTALDKAQNEEHRLENERDRLRAEKQAAATPLRVEQTARNKLAMRIASPAVTEYVAAAPSAPAASEGRR